MATDILMDFDDQVRRDKAARVLQAVWLYDEDAECRQLVDASPEYSVYKAEALRKVDAALPCFGEDYARAVAPQLAEEPMRLVESSLAAMPDDRKETYRADFLNLRTRGGDTRQDYYALYGRMVRDDVRSKWDAQQARIKAVQESLGRMDAYVRGDEFGESFSEQDLANVRSVTDADVLADAEAVRSWMRTYMQPLSAKDDAEEILRTVDALEYEFYEVIRDNPRRAELAYNAMMHWAEGLKQSGKVGVTDEFIVGVGKKLSNWGKAAHVMTPAVAMAPVGHPDFPIMLSDSAMAGQQAELAYRHQEYAWHANARSILRAAINKSLELGDNVSWWKGAARTAAQMAGDSSAYLLPGIGAYTGTADLLVGGATETVDRFSLQGLSGSQAAGQAAIETGVQALVELTPWGRVGGKGLSSFTRRYFGDAIEKGTAGKLSRWVVRNTQNSTARALLAEGTASFVDEGILEPLAGGLLTYGAEQVADGLGIPHAQSREFTECFDELKALYTDPYQAAGLFLFTAGLTGAGAYGVHQNVKYFAHHRKMWEATGLTPEQVDRVMAADDRVELGGKLVREGWETDPAGMRERVLKVNKDFAERGEVLVLTGEGALDAELENSELAPAYRAVWQEYQDKGLLPKVEAVGENQFHITKEGVDITLDARGADAYLQHAIDEVDRMQTRELQQRLGEKHSVDLRAELADAVSTIAGGAAMRAAEAARERTGIAVADITKGLPEWLADGIVKRGQITLKDAQDITEWAIGRIDGLVQEGMSPADARLTRASADGMARTLGDWSTFARDFAHREQLAGLKSGEGATSISRTRNEQAVVFDGRQVLGQTIMTLPGNVRHQGAVEDVTESFADMMVQQRAAAIREAKPESTPAEAEKAAWQGLGELVQRARAAVLKADPEAEIEEVKPGDNMSIIEALSTMATSKFVASGAVPGWMQSLTAALKGNLAAADSLAKVRAAYSSVLQNDPAAVSELDSMLNKLGVYVQDTFREARIEAVDIQAWKHARALVTARAESPAGSGGAPVSEVVQQAGENYEVSAAAPAELRRDKRVTKDEFESSAATPQEVAREAQEILDDMVPGSNAPAEMQDVFVDDKCYYNAAGGFWCGMIDKHKLRDGTEQVKVGTKGKHGVIAGRELTGRFQQNVGAIYVWKRTNGELQVISGRHRFAKLMEDDSAQSCNAYVFVEDAAHDERWARMLDYENNMRDDQADEVTAATYVRETGLSDTELEVRGLMRNGTRCKRGALIGRHAREELWTRFINGAVKPMDAEIICNLTRSIREQSRVEEIQRRCCMLLDEKKSWEYIGAMVQLMANKENIVLKQGLLDFGADFEADLARAAEWIERNIKAINESVSLLKQGRKLSGKKRAEAERLGITTATQEGSEQMLYDLEQLRAQFEMIGSYPDLVAAAQMWDGKTAVDPVGQYLERARAEREQVRAEAEMTTDEYLEEQARKAAEEAVPSLFSMSMTQRATPEMEEIKAAAVKDARYMAAVERGDMDAAQRMVNEVARKRGYLPGSDYQGSEAFNGVAPSSNAYFDTADERYEAWQNGDFEGDISLADFVRRGMDPGELEWMVTSPGEYQRADKYKRESIEAIRKAKTSKQGKVTIYRAVPADVKEKSVRNGDWVTLSKAYAEYHISLQDWEKGRIIKQEVSIDDVWWDGNDVNEWGYDDGKEYAYRNTANNRKLLAPVTYDENGDIVPLSKRFNYRSADVSFSVIGPKAKTWDKYKHRAFTGRDDGMPRAEIDASGAKLKWEDLRGKNVAAYRRIVAGWDNLPEAERKQVETFAEQVYDWQDESQKLNSTPENEFLEQYNKVIKLRDTLKPKRAEIRTLLNKIFVEHGGGAAAVLNMKDAELDELALSLWGPYVESKVEDMLDLRPLWHGGMKLADVLEYPELYEAYPELADITVRYATMDTARGRALYHDGEHEILINRNLEGEWRSIHSILLHEIQHHIQNIEGFAKGGNPSSARRLVDNRAAMGDADALALREHSDIELYDRIAGEIEARNVQARYGWSMDRREAIPFNSTLEYPGEALVTFSMQSVTADWQNTLHGYLNNPPQPGTPAHTHDMVVCPTPAVMQMVGAKGLDMVVTPGVLDKVMKGKHAVSVVALEQLPAAMADPICIAVSDTPGCLEVVTELKEGQHNVLVAVQLNSHQTNNALVKVNRIASMYGKERIGNLMNHPMLYWNKAKARPWLASYRLQLPAIIQPKRASWKKILKPEDLVKYKMDTGLSFAMEKASLRALDLLTIRADERAGEQLIKDWQAACENWGRFAREDAGRLGNGAKMLGEMQALIGATKGVLPERYCRMGHLNGLMRWASIYAKMQQDGTLPQVGEIKGPIYQKFLEKLQQADELNRLQGMSEQEAQEAMALLAGERLDTAMMKVARECRRRLELFLKDRELERIDHIVEKAYPKRQNGQKWPRGKMAADAYRRMERARQYMNLPADEVAERINDAKRKLDALDATDADFERKEEELEEEISLLQTFGCWENMGFEQARRACGVMTEMVLLGRARWKEKLQAERRRANYDRAQISRNFRTKLADVQRKRAKTDAEEKARKRTIGKNLAMDSMSYSHLMLALEPKLGKEFTGRHMRMMAKAHERLQLGTQQLHRRMFSTLSEITGLKTEGEMEEWLKSNNEIIDTGIVLKPRFTETCRMTPEEVEEWLALSKAQREARRKQADEEAAAKRELPDNVPSEEALERMREKLEASRKAGTTPKEYVVTEEERYDSPLHCTKEAMLFAILTFEQEDYTRLMDVNGVNEKALQRMRELVGDKLLRWGYAMRAILNEQGLTMAAVYEAHTGVPFAKRANYFRGVFDNAKAKDKGESIDSATSITGGKYGCLIPRQYHNQRLNWGTSATQVFIGTYKEQQNYICTSHISREWRTLLSNQGFEKRLRAEIGDAALDTIHGWCKLIDGSVIADAKVNAMMNRLLGKAMGAYAVSRLAGSGYTIIKQVSAVLNGFVGGYVPEQVLAGDAVAQQLTYRHIGFWEYVVALARAMIGWTEISAEEIANAGFIAGRKRVKGAHLEEAAMLAPGQSVPGKVGRAGRAVYEANMDAIGNVDRKCNTLAALAVADAVYRAAKRENKDGLVPDAELRRIAIETAGMAIDRAAQPQLRTQKGYWAAGGGAFGAMGNFFYMFKSEVLGKLGLYVGQMFAGHHGAWIGGALSFGVLNSLVLALIDYVRGYWYDDEEDKWEKRAKQFAWNILANDISAVPVLGDLEGWGRSTLLGGRPWNSSLVDMVVPFKDMYSYGKRELKNIDKGASWDKHIQALCGFTRALGSAGGWFQNNSRVAIGSCAELTLAAAAISNITRFTKDLIKKITD